MNEEGLNNISISTGTMIRAMLVLIGVILIWALRDMMLIILTSIVIASFVESAVPHLAKIGFGRVFGIVALYALGIVLCVAMFYLFAPLLITEIYNFSGAISSYVPGVSFLNYFQNEAFSGAKDIVVGLSDNFSFQTLTAVSKAFIENLSGGLFQTLTVAFGSLFYVVSIILFSFYLSFALASECAICPYSGHYSRYYGDGALWNFSSPYSGYGLLLLFRRSFFRFYGRHGLYHSTSI